ncbi:MAG: polysaccharide biosynthesis/export family protein [Planctomycetota bacterium]|jgi:protein involved in polysaccharide export with SLBB domain
MKDGKASVYGLRFTLLLLFLCCIGCSKDYLDPTQLGRFRPVPVVNVILDSLGVVDEPEETYAGAEDPRPEDVITEEQDYTIGRGDYLRITIYELFAEGRPYVNDYLVTETGRVSIPEVGQVRVEGLTEVRLEEEIRDILSPSVLKDPSVSVMVLNSQSRTYSISGGGVGRAGRFSIPRYNYRLLDVIAQAGGAREHNVSYIYVSRRVTGEEPIVSQPGQIDGLAGQPAWEQRAVDREDKQSRPVLPERGDKMLSPQEEMLEIITPSANSGVDGGGIIIASSEMITDEELESLATPEGLEDEPETVIDQARVGGSASGGAGSERVEWVFENGRWLPVRVGPEPGAEPQQTRQPTEPKVPLPPDKETPAGYGWDQIGTAGAQVRIIKIPVAKLLGGDPRYNIVIRPGDSISVPVDIMGEFWVMGNTRGSGPINLTGRPMTLKMAIASAGGLGALAWPQKVEVIRRIGENKEVTVMVDLDKIAKGLQPDFFIKPYDLINVGTHGSSRYLAVLRNAFSLSYGLSFTYGRNFAFRDFTGARFDDLNLERMIRSVF